MITTVRWFLGRLWWQRLPSTVLLGRLLHMTGKRSRHHVRGIGFIVMVLGQIIGPRPRRLVYSAVMPAGDHIAIKVVERGR